MVGHWTFAGQVVEVAACLALWGDNAAMFDVTST